MKTLKPVGLFDTVSFRCKPYFDGPYRYASGGGRVVRISPSGRTLHVVQDSPTHGGPTGLEWTVRTHRVVILIRNRPCP